MLFIFPAPKEFDKGIQGMQWSGLSGDSSEKSRTLSSGQTTVENPSFNEMENRIKLPSKCFEVCVILVIYSSEVCVIANGAMGG